MAQAFHRLGAPVTVIAPGPILSREDRDAADLVLARLRDEGVVFEIGREATLVAGHAGKITVTLSDGHAVTGSHLLVATGRRANVAELDLGAAGVETCEDGIEVDARRRTANKRIYAIGDCRAGPRFTHVAGYEGSLVALDIALGVPGRVDWRALPRVLYTDPELAQIGSTEAEVRKLPGSVEVTRENFIDNDRAVTEGDAQGFLKLIRCRGKVVGVTIVGAHAGELLLPWAQIINGKATPVRARLGYRRLSDPVGGLQGGSVPGLLAQDLRHLAEALGGDAGAVETVAVMTRARTMPTGPSPFRVEAPPLPPAKFIDPAVTATGEPRAQVPFLALDTLWFNTGTLCNVACATCYIESSPTNDALVYLTKAEVARFIDEIADRELATREIGFTGGEPFLNPEIIAMLDLALGRSHKALVLTNAMRPMRRHQAALLELREQYGARLTLRVSLDHYSPAVHEAERGARSWQPALGGLHWLSANGFSIAVAGRHLAAEPDAAARAGYADLFAAENIAIDPHDPARLILFPEMDAAADVAEITTACWGILGQSPTDLMCSSSRMIVHRRDEPRARVVACTLIPYDPGFDLGETLAEATRPIALNHPHCARFCVLGGASCSG